MELQRTLSAVIKKISKDFPVLLLTGMRQTGKTYLLKSMMEPGRKYVTLDSPDDRELAKAHPDLFLQRYTPPVIIDEVQYAPELLTYIKIYADTHGKGGLFWLTGSQKFSLMKGIQESLAGRIAVLDLLGLSYDEMILKPQTRPFLPSMNTEKFDVKPLRMLDLYKIIWNGSFPRLFVNRGRNREIFYRSYLQTYVERDIRDYQGITDTIKFHKFIRACAVRTGNLLNCADMARDADIDTRTIKTWLAALQRSGLIKLLYPYYTNITKRLVKTPKLYFMYTGHCSFLGSFDTPAALEAGYLSGAILETWAFAEIIRSYWHNGSDPSIYFYRDADQREIDFVIEANMTLYPIEVKKTSAPTADHSKNFNLLSKLDKPAGTGAVLCLRPTALPLGEKAVALPVWGI
ncbi:MAG: ATP-binding protein [Treponema sp.]|nr:ATP-binding protein [Treponema sp.]